MQITNRNTGATAMGQVQERCIWCGQGDLGGLSYYFVKYARSLYNSFLIRVQFADLSVSLFEQLGDVYQGVIPVEWKYV